MFFVIYSRHANYLTIFMFFGILFWVIKLKYDIEKLTSLFKAFSDVSNININLLDKNMNASGYKTSVYNKYCKEIQSAGKGYMRCRDCDNTILKKCCSSKNAQMHICHAGLIDIAVPVLYTGEIVGYTIMGQVRTNADFSEISELLHGLNIDYDKMQQYYNELPMFNYDKIQSILTIAEFFSKYIISENILHFEINDLTPKHAHILITILRKI